jgi:ABC-2 type transport system ATP-binding protein
MSDGPVGAPESTTPASGAATGVTEIVASYNSETAEFAGSGALVAGECVHDAHKIEKASNRRTKLGLARARGPVLIPRSVISVSHLVKRYGSHLAVDDVSFDVAKGEVVGFLGPNGAGKSTTLRILSGFLGATEGTVEINGHDVEKESLKARQSIGYMPEAVPIYPEMRVAEYLTFRAELKRVASAKRKAHVEDAMEKAGVADVATTLIGNLSKGYKQRVGLADALVANPPILILDEPTAGLDPNQIREVRTVIAALADDHTVVLSTHILSEVEASCTKVILIAKGKLLTQGKTEDIRAMRRSGGVDITVRGDKQAAMTSLKGLAGIEKISDATPKSTAKEISVIRISWGKKAENEAIASTTEKAVAALVSAGVFIREVKSVGGSLEDVFTSLTSDAAASTEDAS